MGCIKTETYVAKETTEKIKRLIMIGRKHLQYCNGQKKKDVNASNYEEGSNPNWAKDMNRQITEEGSARPLFAARSTGPKEYLREGIRNDVMHELLKERKIFSPEGNRLEWHPPIKYNAKCIGNFKFSNSHLKKKPKEKQE